MPCRHGRFTYTVRVPSTRGSGSASGARKTVQRFSWLPALPPDPPQDPAWRRPHCSDRSSVRCGHPTSRQRRCRAYGLWPSPTRPPLTAQRAPTRSPSSCAKSFSACSGSMTAWSPPGTGASVPSRVAFRTARLRRRSRWLITRLNGWPAASPVNASTAPSRAPPHDSGSGWFAIPSLYRTFIDYSLPVSWRTMLPPLPRRSRLAVLTSLIRPVDVSLPRYGSRVGLRIDLFEACSAFTRVAACTLALSPIRGSLTRRLQPLRYLHGWESSGGNPSDLVRPAALAEPDLESYSIRLPA